MKKLILITLCLCALLLTTPTAALADVGPKRSVVVEFEGLEQENCYVTLLSKSDSTGPYSAYRGTANSAHYFEGDEDFSVWEKFVSYEDKDGFYFLQYFAKLGDNLTFTWGYYPPTEFKILLYFPAEDYFVVSEGIYEQYAFDSYYQVDARDLSLQPAETDGAFRAEKNYDYTWEIISLLARIFATILLELGIALLFGFRAKKQLFIIAAVNVVTQTLLNILLNVINYSQGQMAFVLSYIGLEFIVVIIEAVVFYYALNKYSDKPPAKKGLPVWYALAANLFSFIAGLGLAYLIPGIF